MNHGDDLIEIIGPKRIEALRQAYATKHGGVVDLSSFEEALRGALVTLGFTVRAKPKQEGPRHTNVSRMGEEARKFYRQGDIYVFPSDQIQLSPRQETAFGKFAYVRVHDDLIKLWTKGWLDADFNGISDHPLPPSVRTKIKAGLRALTNVPRKFTPAEFSIGELFPRSVSQRRDRVPYVVFRNNMTEVEPLTQMAFENGEADGDPVINATAWWPALQAFDKDARFWEVGVDTTEIGGCPYGIVAMRDMGGNVAISHYDLP